MLRVKNPACRGRGFLLSTPRQDNCAAQLHVNSEMNSTKFPLVLASFRGLRRRHHSRNSKELQLARGYSKAPKNNSSKALRRTCQDSNSLLFTFNLHSPVSFKVMAASNRI